MLKGIKTKVKGRPGGPVVKTPHSQCGGQGVQSLVRELDPTCHNERSCRLQQRSKKILRAATKIWYSQINK